MLSPDDTARLARAYDTLRRLAPRIENLKIPVGGAPSDAYRPPAHPGPKPPCNLAWVSAEIDALDLLQRTARQVTADTMGLHGRPVPGLAGHAGWLSHQVEHISSTMWVDSPTWWAIQLGDRESTGTDTLFSQTVQYARYLEDALDPPIKHPPAGSAIQMSVATGVPVETIKTWRKRGDIPGFRIGNRWYYRRSDIEKTRQGKA
ncbi:helix-turn-helix domain-containing protein [Corynebacterium sp. H113]|uniref:helix-turn-helix domain-containing protein n=1 Tax=Corynebacterium sp. H113 TaxID=3133419 RepID=UPI00309A1C7D